MWKLSCQFSKPNSEFPEQGLELNELQVETLCEAIAWWECRTGSTTHVDRVHTMTDPTGKVVKVKFD